MAQSKRLEERNLLQPLQQKYNEQIIALWQTCLPQFQLTERLLQQNVWNSPYVLQEGSALKVIDEQVVGIVIAKAWHDTHGIKLNAEHGWIQMLLVHPDYRRQGIGDELYSFAEKALLIKGVKKIQIGGDVGHVLCGVPLTQEAGVTFVEKHGYKRLVESVDFVRELTKPLVMPEHDGAEFVLLKPEEKDVFLQFMARAFPGRWTFEAYDYFAYGGTGRDYVVVKKDGHIVGFCRMNDEQSAWQGPNYNWAEQFESLGGIGPLGVEAAYRKFGYGRAVVEAAEVYLQQRGKKTLFIDWTDLIAFYEKLGYTIWQNYGIYVKQV